MTISQMLQQSGLLTLLGLCVVFAFLIVLILAMNLLRVVVHALKLDKTEEKKGTSSAAPSAQASADNTAVIAAIAAAVREKELQ